MADISGVQHGFWVVLGTLSVLRTNAASTESTALRALGGTLLGLHQFPDLATTDAFNERRPGLDHVAFGCADRGELETWAARLDELGISHGAIKDAGYGSGVSFRDPDNIALEFFAPPS